MKEKNTETDQELEKQTFDPILEDAIGSFGARLKEALEIRSISVRSFAKRVGVTEASIRNYIKGRMPQLDVLVRMAAILNMDLNVLLNTKPFYNNSTPEHITDEIGRHYLKQADEDDEKGIRKEDLKKLSEYDFIPGYNVSVSAGHGTWAEDSTPTRFLAFRKKWLSYRKLTTDNCCVVFAKGDSMQPTINSGDSLLVNTEDKELADGSIYVLRVGDVLFAKRLQRSFDGSVELISDNKEYHPQLVPPSELEQLQIIGKVVWVGKDIF